MFEIMARLLAFCYSLVPNYAIAIAMFTLIIMIALAPFTIKQTRSMLLMQRLAPELKKLQVAHKDDKAKLNAEMMALYKEHKINPLSACLPIFAQMPILFGLYQVLTGLTREVKGELRPRYLSESSKLYKDLVESSGEMVSFGMDFARKASENHPTLSVALPFYGLIAAMVVIQYLQQRQISSRSTNSQSNTQQKQMQMMQKIMPPMLGVFAWSLPAGVVLYWVIQGLTRIAQQWAMYRFDPRLTAHLKEAREEIDEMVAADKNKAPARVSKRTTTGSKRTTTGSKRTTAKKKGR